MYTNQLGENTFNAGNLHGLIAIVDNGFDARGLARHALLLQRNIAAHKTVLAQPDKLKVGIVQSFMWIACT